MSSKNKRLSTTKRSHHRSSEERRRLNRQGSLDRQDCQILRAFQLALVFSLILAGMAGTAGATSLPTLEFCDPCVVRLAPHTTEASLPLTGWMIPHNTIALEVLSAPRFGNWRDQTYRPNPETFWTAGSDQIVFKVITASGRHAGKKTLIILGAEADYSHQENLDFSSIDNIGDLPDWISLATTPNPARKGRPVPGNDQTLRLENGELSVLAQEGHSLWLEGPGSKSSGNETLVMGGEVEARSDDGPGTIFGTHHWITERIWSFSDFLWIDRRSIDHDGDPSTPLIFEARASLNPERFGSCRPACATDWLEITDLEHQVLAVDAAQRVLGHPEMNEWSLRFWVRDEDPHRERSDQIWAAAPGSQPQVWSTRIGAMETLTSDPEDKDLTEIVRIREFSSYAGNFTQPAVFHTDFRASTGTYSAASENESSLYFEGEQAQNHHSADGLLIAAEMVYPEVFPSDGASVLVTTTGERSAVTHFSLDQADEIILNLELATTLPPSSSNRGDLYPAWSAFDILEVGADEGRRGVGPIRLRMRVDGQGRRAVQLRVMGTYDCVKWATDWVETGSSDLKMAIHWKQSDGIEDAPNGFVHFDINGQRHSVTELENHELAAEFVTVGSWSVSYMGSSPLGTQMPLVLKDILVVDPSPTDLDLP